MHALIFCLLPVSSMIRELFLVILLIASSRCLSFRGVTTAKYPLLPSSKSRCKGKGVEVAFLRFVKCFPDSNFCRLSASRAPLNSEPLEVDSNDFNFISFISVTVYLPIVVRRKRIFGDRGGATRARHHFRLRPHEPASWNHRQEIEYRIHTTYDDFVMVVDCVVQGRLIWWRWTGRRWWFL